MILAALSTIFSIAFGQTTIQAVCTKTDGIPVTESSGLPRDLL
jgi:hypothetical protein